MPSPKTDLPARITTGMVIRAAWENYTDEYIAGKTVAQISRESGLGHSTITERFKRTHNFIPNRRAGAIPLTHCKRDHDMKVHGKPVKPGSPQLYCSECRRIRERVTPDNQE